MSEKRYTESELTPAVLTELRLRRGDAGAMYHDVGDDSATRAEMSEFDALLQNAMTDPKIADELTRQHRDHMRKRGQGWGKT